MKVQRQKGKSDRKSATPKTIMGIPVIGTVGEGAASTLDGKPMGPGSIDRAHAEALQEQERMDAPKVFRYSLAINNRRAPKKHQRPNMEVFWRDGEVNLEITAHPGGGWWPIRLKSVRLSLRAAEAMVKKLKAEKKLKDAKKKRGAR